MSRLAFILLAASACATDSLELDPTLPAVEEPQSTLDEPVPAATPAARDLRISCATRIDGREQLGISVTSDLDVALAFAQLRAGEQQETLELDFRFPEPLDVEGATIFSKTALVNSGNLILDAASPVTCARLADFGVHVTVVFESGAVACVTGGNASEAAGFICE